MVRELKLLSCEDRLRVGTVLPGGVSGMTLYPPVTEGEYEKLHMDF